MQCFVVGNGKSRAEIPLHNLKKYGKVYGCNALYRDFAPDVLVAVDENMAVEIGESRYQENNTVWTNANSKTVNFKNFNFFTPNTSYASGTAALSLATKTLPNEIYLIGFDFAGDNGIINNIYAGTANYRAANSKATFYGNWQHHIEQIIKNNPNIQYYRVKNDKYQHTLYWDYTNFKELSIIEFIQNFQLVENL